MLRFSVLFLSLFLHQQLLSQVLPKEGSRVFCRIVGFSFPGKNTGSYKIEIASGNYRKEDSFKKNITLVLSGSGNKIFGEVPCFNTGYTWRVVDYTGHAGRKEDKFHHFSTIVSPTVDTGINRLRVTDKALKYDDAFVFLDANRALYDMNGRPVWFLPNIEGAYNENSYVRDLKLTPQGTVTFLIDGSGAYEINLNGDILWKAPDNGAVSGDSTEHYHHQFTRRPDGHYMVLGTEFALWKVPSPEDSSLVIIEDNKSTPFGQKEKYQKSPWGTIIEYDEKGNVVWSWKSAAYFNGSDLFHHRTPRGDLLLHTHENGFYFDEHAMVIYVSFRDIDRVVKIHYPDKSVLNTFGERFRAGITEKGSGLFCRQHSCMRSREGYLCLYNNNICNYPALPEVLMMQEPVTDSGSLKKVWEYSCTIEGMNLLKKDAPGFTSGGSVSELPDGSLFVSMSAPYGKVFIVNRDKKLLWNALPEKWNNDEKKWVAFPQYRASIITDRKQLEQLIWNTEK